MAMVRGSVVGQLLFESWGRLFLLRNQTGSRIVARGGGQIQYPRMVSMQLLMTDMLMMAVILDIKVCVFLAQEKSRTNGIKRLVVSGYSYTVGNIFNLQLVSTHLTGFLWSNK